jgi:hypothetical protein
MGVISVAVKHLTRLGATPEQILELIQELEAEIGVHKPATEPTTDFGGKNTQENQLVTSVSGQYIDYKPGKGDRGVRGERGKPVKTPTTDLEFNRFWQIYPRREAKGAAQRAFRSALKRGEVEPILAAARKYAEKRRGEDKQYTAMAATWLNQDRWLDEEQTKQYQVLDGPKRTYAEIKAERERNALVCGDDEGPKRGASPKKSAFSRVSDFLPALHGVDQPQENQAPLLAEAVSDEVSFCGNPWDEPEAFDL